MSNFVKRVTKNARQLPIDTLSSDNSLLANRLIDEESLLVFLYGWFAMGARRDAPTTKEMALLVRGSKPTPLKNWCSIAYLYGFVGRDWPSALRMMLLSHSPACPNAGVCSASNKRARQQQQSRRRPGPGPKVPESREPHRVE